jgi:hypothetical protein
VILAEELRRLTKLARFLARSLNDLCQQRFSLRSALNISPSKLEHPGPPLSQIRISFSAAGFAEGKNQKNNSEAWVLLEMGIRPA